MKRISYERIKSRYGYVFISLWLIGMVVFFLIPFIQSVIYSFSSMEIQPGNVILTFVGWDNYRQAFGGDPEFMPAFTSSLGQVIAQTPLINIFALFIAIILNQKFHGRLLARSIFFLPVIVSSGVVMNIINGDANLTTMMTGQRASYMFESMSIQEILYDMGMNSVLTNYIVTTVNQIFNLSWQSGIQILIYLAGLQSISPSMYEVAKIDGATAWETFWKVTFPLIAPMILVNVVYTMIDVFINYSNPVFKLIQDTASRTDFAYASAMSIINFLVIFLLIGVVGGLISRRVYYAAD